MRIDELTVGQLLRAKLAGDKKVVKRRVSRIRVRTNLTQVQTQYADDANRREVFELRSGMEV